MTDKMIRSAGPSITDKEVQLVTEAARHGWYENMSLYIDEFEKRFSVYTGMKYCLATNNCIAAIHLALLGLNIDPNDEVIVPDITWVASTAPMGFGTRKAAADTEFIDGWGYLGAGLQGVGTGLMVDRWGWNAGFVFWIACAFLAAGLMVLLWRYKPPKREYL